MTLDRYTPALRWIDSQHERMCRLVTEWSAINSGTSNVAGVERCAAAVAHAFQVLGGEMRWMDLAPPKGAGALGRALHIVKRPSAPLRVLLAIHVDTVYGAEDAFQTPTRIDRNTLRGPGVADAKGGLAVMLVALEALERDAALAGRLGWDVFINPDEEIGSPGSAPVLASLARDHALGMLFEPSLPDGALVAARKGSGNFSAHFSGRAAHAGRDPHAGRNAVHAMAEFVVALTAVQSASGGISVNVGRVDGGGPVNVVPDRAACHFNVRVVTADEQQRMERHLEQLRDEFNARDGLSLTVSGAFTAPPKPLDGPTLRLLEELRTCGESLGLNVNWRDSGGVCDGNRLAAAGLPNVDSLGPRGGALHSPGEFLLLDSLTERAKLSALLLMRLASGEFQWPAPRGASR